MLLASSGPVLPSSFAASASVDGVAVVRPRALPRNGLDRIGEALAAVGAEVVLASSLCSSGAAVVRVLLPGLPPNLGRENPG